MSQRIIKFRAWDIGKSEMIYDGIEYALRCLKLSEEGEFTCIGFSPSETLNYKIMQFTGLYDKNGVEIYEGDVIEFTYWWFDGNEVESTLTGVIVYSDANMSYQLKGVKNKEWQRHTGYEDDNDYLTPFSELNFEEADFGVIGNVYENPELIKPDGEQGNA